MSGTGSGGASPLVVVGRVQGPYGVRGWVHLASFTEPNDNILHYRPWFSGGREGADEGWQLIEVEEIRPHKQGFVARIRGIENRDAALELKGALIGVPERELPLAAPDEYYWRDLIGALVCSRDGLELGLVTGLLETGAHDVLVVKRTGAGDEPDLLIPFHRNYVVSVDMSGPKISVDWPADA